MTLSTRVTLAAAGGVLAIGVLGAGGAAYASSSGSGSGSGTTSFVTTVDDGPAAPSTGDRGDCPDKQGGGTGSASPEAPAPGSSGDA